MYNDIRFVLKNKRVFFYSWSDIKLDYFMMPKIMILHCLEDYYSKIKPTDDI